MGAKPSINLPSDRPESGGADRDMIREKSGLLEHEKEKFAVEQQRKFAAERPAQRDEAHRDSPAPPSDFSIDNPRNPDPRTK